MTLPALRDQRGFDAVGIRDEVLETRLEVQQHEFGVEFEAQRVAEGRFDREPAQIVGRAAELPQHDRARGARDAGRPCA